MITISATLAWVFIAALAGSSAGMLIMHSIAWRESADREKRHRLDLEQLQKAALDDRRWM